MKKDSKLRLNIQITLLSITMVLLISVQPGLADLPPSAYKEMQESAPEYIDIEVLKVKTEKVTDAIMVDIEAKVTGVKRSESNLKAGDTIVIRYFHDTRGLIGPAPIPILDEGKSYPAFLVKEDGNDFYQPSAMGRSFSVVN
ncbi:MAG TPA: hypothetical protein VNN20_17570 [Thermodesulfobacteriota bacterium]|nr:hypothetical protein [Thermodesulfobacteriota bacterium]